MARELEPAMQAAAWSALFAADPELRRRAIAQECERRGDPARLADEIDALAQAIGSAAELERATRGSVHRDTAIAAGLALFDADWSIIQIPRLQSFGLSFDEAVAVLIRRAMQALAEIHAA